MCSQLESKCILEKTLLISSVLGGFCPHFPTTPIPSILTQRPLSLYHHLHLFINLIYFNFDLFFTFKCYYFPMAPDLGLTPLAPPQKSNQQLSTIESIFNSNNSNNNSNNDNEVNQMSQNDDDSWEVRAFEEDTTGNLLGCTWPPRSYTCTFCRREFRSAQALGGHMNVHRRDRARLHETPAQLHPSPPPILIQTAGREFAANGLCLVYPFLPNPSSIIFPNPSPLDYSSHFVTNKPTETALNSGVSSPSASNSNDNNKNSNRGLDENTKDSGGEEELDLELRLGRRPPP